GADDVQQRFRFAGVLSELVDDPINPLRKFVSIAAAKHDHASTDAAKREQLKRVPRGLLAVSTILCHNRLVFKEFLLDWQGGSRTRLKVKMIRRRSAALRAVVQREAA